MTRYVLRRVIGMIPVLFLVSLIVFGIMHALPGDPVGLMLMGAEGGVATPERLAEMRHELGLDDPLVVQYGRFLTHALVGDLGMSVRFHQPVTDLVVSRFGSTLQLALCGLLLATVVGLPLGLLAAVRQGTWVDTLSSGFAYLGASMPVYWSSLLLILFFSFTLRWFPSAGGETWSSLVLPSVALGLGAAALITRLVRSNMIEVMGEDFIRTGRSKGLSEFTLIRAHALRNVLIPVVTVIGLQFGTMLAGAVITETVFSRPGLGRMTVDAILSKDYPLVQGCVLFVAVVYLLVNLLVDITYSWIDPRVTVAAA